MWLQRLRTDWVLHPVCCPCIAHFQEADKARSSGLTWGILKVERCEDGKIFTCENFFTFSHVKNFTCEKFSHVRYPS